MDNGTGVGLLVSISTPMHLHTEENPREEWHYIHEGEKQRLSVGLCVGGGAEHLVFCVFFSRTQIKATSSVLGLISGQCF